MRKRDRELSAAFRQALKTAMQKKGLKGYELAKAAGIWPTNISNYLAGKSLPSGSVLMKLARALDLEPEALIPQSGRALSGRVGQAPSERFIGGRVVLDEMEILLRDLRKRWEQQDGSAIAVSGGDLVLPKERKRRSKGS